MPWTTNDVDRFIKGLSDAEKKKWVEAANQILADCKANKGKDCEGRAVRVANSLFSKKEATEYEFTTAEIKSLARLVCKLMAADYGNCICPACGFEIVKEAGNPCQTVDCPKCGTKMIRDTTKADCIEINSKPESREKKLMYVPIEKQDEDKRLVYGVVLAPETVDLQGDIYDAETIEKAAHNFLFNVRRMGLMHREFDKEMKVAESFIAPVDMTWGERKVKQGSWVMACKVVDDSVWKGIKNGTYRGFSIGAYIKYLTEGDDVNA